MQTSRRIEIAPDVEIVRLNLSRLCECFRMAADPGRLLSVSVSPCVVQHANFKVGDMTPRGFLLKIIDQQFHVSVGPGIVATPLSHDCAGKSHLRLLPALRGSPGQLSVFIDPSILPGSGGERDSLLKIPGPLHDRANGPSNVQQDAAVATDSDEKRLKPVPKLLDC